MSQRLCFTSAAALVALIAAPGWASPSRAAADDDVASDSLESGHFSLSAGVHAGDDAGLLTARAQMRAELAFNVAGPIAIGGFAQVVFGDHAMEQPGFGGGLLITLRPELPLLGFVPHLEITGARLQLPTGGQGLVDAWSMGVGGGIGYAVVSDIVIEARVQHAWYFGLPDATSLSDRAWTVGAALSIDLP